MFASCFLSGSAGSAAKIYGTTTGTVTIGDGPVNIGKANSATTVDGTMTVTQTLNMGAHIVATSTGVAKSVSNTASDLYTYTYMNDRRKGRDSGEETGRETQRVCDYTLTLTHAYMTNPPLDSVYDYGSRYDRWWGSQPWSG